jgi:hypothetical protein
MASVEQPLMTHSPAGEPANGPLPAGNDGAPSEGGGKGMTMVASTWVRQRSGSCQSCSRTRFVTTARPAGPAAQQPSTPPRRLLSPMRALQLQPGGIPAAAATPLCPTPHPRPHAGTARARAGRHSPRDSCPGQPRPGHTHREGRQQVSTAGRLVLAGAVLSTCMRARRSRPISEARGRRLPASPARPPAPLQQSRRCSAHPPPGGVAPHPPHTSAPTPLQAGPGAAAVCLQRKV